MYYDVSLAEVSSHVQGRSRRWSVLDSWWEWWVRGRGADAARQRCFDGAIGSVGDSGAAISVVAAVMGVLFPAAFVSHSDRSHLPLPGMMIVIGPVAGAVAALVQPSVLPLGRATLHVRYCPSELFCTHMWYRQTEYFYKSAFRLDAAHWSSAICPKARVDLHRSVLLCRGSAWVQTAVLWAGGSPGLSPFGLCGRVFAAGLDACLAICCASGRGPRAVLSACVDRVSLSLPGRASEP